MKYEFKENDLTKIKNKFGQNFYRKVCDLLETLIEKWQIESLDLLNSFSSSLVFQGLSRQYDAVVLKFVIDQNDFLGEMSALKYFDGGIACQLIDVDVANQVLLLESILPGTELSKEPKIESRLEVFCEVYNQLHIHRDHQYEQICKIESNRPLKTYQDWVFRITAYMEDQKDWQDITAHMKKAKALYTVLSQNFTDQSLLHGDFHYHNILQSNKGYKIIDPKGVIGNPIFDIPRYMLNEFWAANGQDKLDDIMERTFSMLSLELDISKALLTQLLYIEGAMAISWCVESGASIDDKVNYLNILDKLLQYMKSKE